VTPEQTRIFKERWKSGQRDCERLLDRGVWKHSWHLPKQHGYTNWHHKGTVKALREQIDQAREEARELRNLAARVEKFVNDTLAEEEL
jgi:hypothetical protein